MTRDSSLTDIVAAILVGLVFLAILAAFFVVHTKPADVSTFVRDYQSLIGAVLGLIGTVATIVFAISGIEKQIKTNQTSIEKQITAHSESVQLQIQNDHDAQRQERERRNIADRAILSQHLSSLIDYSKHNVTLLHSIIEANPKNEFESVSTTETPSLAPLPEGSLIALRDCIISSEPRAAIRLALLINTIQVQRSRLSGALDSLRGDPGEPNNVPVSWIIRCLCDAAEIEARCQPLFTFCRAGEVIGEIHPSPDDMRTVFISRIFSTKASEQLDRLIERYPEKAIGFNWVSTRS